MNSNEGGCFFPPFPLEFENGLLGFTDFIRKVLMSCFVGFCINLKLGLHTNMLLFALIQKKFFDLRVISEKSMEMRV